MWESYQFLRYYIPGNLFLIYLILFLSPFLTVEAISLEVWVSAILGGFVISSPLGYILYSLYDQTFYVDISRGKKNPYFFRKNNRKILKIVKSWIEEDKEVDVSRIPKESLNSLIDFGLHSDLKNGWDEFIITSEILDTLRGFWSHHNARYVSSVFVPVASFIVWAISLITLSKTKAGFIGFHEYSWVVFLMIVILISILSILIGRGINFTCKPGWRPTTEKIRMEIYALEEYLVRARENTIKKMIDKMKDEWKRTKK